MHLRARQVERLGDERHGLRRHVAEGGLYVVEDGQQRTLAPRVAADDVVGLRFVPRRHARDAPNGYRPDLRPLLPSY